VIADAAVHARVQIAERMVVSDDPHHRQVDRRQNARMYRSRIDAERGLLIGLFTGSTNDDDYARYVESILEADRVTRPETAKLAILLVDRENPAPNAQWRKRIADASARIRTQGALFVLCAESPIIRGVVTAINWIRPPKYETRIVSTPEAALEIVAERRASAVAAAKRIIEELRAEARRPRTG
jgi:hypothetical protein